MRRLSDIVCNQKPLKLLPSCSVEVACREMRDNHVGSVLVIDEKQSLVGIFTGRDAVVRVLAEGKSAARTHLSDVMTQKPTTMTPQETAIDALRLMWDGGFRHVPVVDKGKIYGVVSRGDFRAEEDNRLEQERELWEHIR